MIYDLLESYRSYLLSSYRPTTANTYYNRLGSLLSGQSLTDTVNKLDIEQVLNKLRQIKHKNYFSQSKNALLLFCQFQNIQLSADTLETIKALEERTKKKYRNFEPLDYNQVSEKIKRIRNKKLKLSFQAMLATGLRVSELAGITKNDCIVTDSDISFSFFGKGGENEIVILQATEYSKLYQILKEYILLAPQNKKLFYSVPYLQRKANELGFKCHDLRRAFAKLEYKKCKSKHVVMKKLRHSSIKNTDIYLRSKIDI